MGGDLEKTDFDFITSVKNVKGKKNWNFRRRNRNFSTLFEICAKMRQTATRRNIRSKIIELTWYTYSEIIRHTVIQADLGHKSRGTATSVELGQQKAGIWGLLLQTVFEGRKEVGLHKHCVDQKKIDVHVDFIHLFWNHRTVIQADLGHKSMSCVLRWDDKILRKGYVTKAWGDLAVGDLGAAKSGNHLEL